MSSFYLIFNLSDKNSSPSCLVGDECVDVELGHLVVEHSGEHLLAHALGQVLTCRITCAAPC
jgi:hypothetical protein